MRGTRKRTLVTGGAGFIGSHVCERLLDEGSDVLCVDNYYTGSQENISGILNNPFFEALRHDVTFPLYVEVDEIEDYLRRTKALGGVVATAKTEIPSLGWYALIKDPDGSKRKALARDYTDIRWKVLAPLLPSVEGAVGFRAKIK